MPLIIVSHGCRISTPILDWLAAELKPFTDDKTPF
jgi:hypothetical protein